MKGKSVKRSLALLLSIVMVLGLFTSAFAEGEVISSEEGNLTSNLEYEEGGGGLSLLSGGDSGVVTVAVYVYCEDTDGLVLGDFVVNGIEGEEITINAPSYPGYTTPSDVQYIVPMGGGTHTFTYVKDVLVYGSLRVKFLDKETNQSITQELYVEEMEVGPFTVNAVLVDGYTLEGDDAQTVDIVAGEETIVTFLYNKIPETKFGSIRIKFLEEGTQLSLAEDIVSDVEVGEFTAYPIEIQGYLPLESEATVIIEEGQESVIIFFYKAPEFGSVRIKYLELDTNEPLAEEVVGNDIPVGTFTVNAIDIPGYVLVSLSSLDVEIKPNEETVATFYYEVPLQGTITVECVDTQGMLLTRNISGELELGSHVISAPVIEGYSVTGESEITVILSRENWSQLVTFIYLPDSPGEGTITVHYEDEDGNPIKESDTFIGINFDAPKTIYAPVIEDYDVIGEDAIELTLTEAEPTAEITFVYAEKPKYGIIKIHYVDEEGIAIKETLTEQLLVGETKVYTAPGIDDYILIENLSYYELTAVEGEVVEATFTYKKLAKLPSRIIIIAKDEQGITIASKEVEKEVIGQYEIDAPIVSGYTLVGENKATVNVDKLSEVYIVNFLYKKDVVPTTGKVVIKCLEGTREIRVIVKNNLEFGEHIFTAPEITNYKLNSSTTKIITLSPSNADVEVVFYYVYIGSTDDGGSGGGGGGSRDDDQPSKPEEPKKETPVVKPEANLSNITPETLVTKGNVVVLSEEIFKASNERVTTTLDSAQYTAIEEQGLTARLFKWNADRNRWVPVATNSNNGVVQSKELVTGEVAIFAVEEPKFVDTTGNEWFDVVADKAKGYGIISGVTNQDGEHELQPNRTVTTAEFYTMIGRVFGAVGDSEFPLYDTLPKATGVISGDWYAPYQSALYAGGFIEALEEKIVMNGGITRLDAMVLLTKLLQASEENVPVRDSYEFADMSHIPNVQISSTIAGYPDGTLQPEGTLTRIEALTLIIQALDSMGW